MFQIRTKPIRFKFLLGSNYYGLIFFSEGSKDSLLIVLCAYNYEYLCANVCKEYCEPLWPVSGPSPK